MKFSVVIVNYNVKYYLEQCLCSLYRAIDNLSAEIFVVDNASVDDDRSIENLGARFDTRRRLHVVVGVFLRATRYRDGRRRQSRGFLGLRPQQAKAN